MIIMSDNDSSSCEKHPEEEWGWASKRLRQIWPTHTNNIHSFRVQHELQLDSYTESCSIPILTNLDAQIMLNRFQEIHIEKIFQKALSLNIGTPMLNNWHSSLLHVYSIACVKSPADFYAFLKRVNSSPPSSDEWCALCTLVNQSAVTLSAILYTLAALLRGFRDKSNTFKLHPHARNAFPYSKSELISYIENLLSQLSHIHADALEFVQSTHSTTSTISTIHIERIGFTKLHRLFQFICALHRQDIHIDETHPLSRA